MRILTFGTRKSIEKKGSHSTERGCNEVKVRSNAVQTYSKKGKFSNTDIYQCVFYIEAESCTELPQ